MKKTKSEEVYYNTQQQNYKGQNDHCFGDKILKLVLLRLEIYTYEEWI